MCTIFDVDILRIRRRSPEITSYRDLLAALLAEPSAVLLPLVLIALVLAALSGAKTSSTRQSATAKASLEALSTVAELAPPGWSRRFGRK